MFIIVTVIFYCLDIYFVWILAHAFDPVKHIFLLVVDVQFM